MEAKRTTNERLDVPDDGDDAGRRQSRPSGTHEAVFRHPAADEPKC